MRASERLEPAASVVAKCGGVAATAKIIGRDPSVVRRWMLRPPAGTGGRVPMHHAQKLLPAVPALTEADFFLSRATGLSLDGWMRERGVEDEELARAAECSRSTISRLRRGKQCASPALAERIAAISGGAVAAERLTGAPATRERAA